MPELLPSFTLEDIPDHWEFEEKPYEGLEISAFNPISGFLSIKYPTIQGRAKLPRGNYSDYFFNTAGKPIAYLKQEGNWVNVRAGDLDTKYVFFESTVRPAKSPYEAYGLFEMGIQTHSLPDSDLAEHETYSAIVEYSDWAMTYMKFGRCFSIGLDGNPKLAPVVEVYYENREYGVPSSKKYRLDFFLGNKYKKLDIEKNKCAVILPEDIDDPVDNRSFIVNYKNEEDFSVLEQIDHSAKIQKNLVVPKKLNMGAIVSCLFKRASVFEMIEPGFLPEWVNIEKLTGVKLFYQEYQMLPPW